MGRRREFTSAEKAALWEGWKKGVSLVEIGRGLDRRASTVLNFIHRAGGYAPRPQRRSACALKACEREEISRGMAQQMSIRAIARKLQRPASTISREIARNGGTAAYRASEAEARAWEQAKRPQRCRLARALETLGCLQAAARLVAAPDRGWLASSFPR